MGFWATSLSPLPWCFKVWGESGAAGRGGGLVAAEAQATQARVPFPPALNASWDAWRFPPSSGSSGAALRDALCVAGCCEGGEEGERKEQGSSSQMPAFTSSCFSLSARRAVARFHLRSVPISGWCDVQLASLSLPVYAGVVRDHLRPAVDEGGLKKLRL